MSHKSDNVQVNLNVMRTEKDMHMVNELRNHHVKKLLNHLGGESVAPYLQKAIKRAFSEFAEDIINAKDNTYDPPIPYPGQR